MEQNKRSAPGAVLAALGKALCYLLLFLLCQTVVTVVYSAAAALYVILSQGAASPDLMDEILRQVYSRTGQISLISNAAMLLLLAGFFLLRKKNPLREVGAVSAPLSITAAAAGLAPVFYLAVTLIMSLLPADWLESYAQAAAPLEETGPVMLLSVVIAAPLAEEVIFRGLILSRLKRAMPGWLAVVISALLFGVCHGHPVWIAYAFVLGLFFGLMAHRSGSIVPSLLAHLIFNAIGQLSVALGEESEAMIPLYVLAAAGLVVCLLARKGLAALFRIPPIRKEHDND